ncbi:RNA polymerase sigma factor [Thermoleophilum album]|uniref:RNA polymerase sigma factor n=1 Tax=Thermoleophilum album TaxID=29539 RepID=UPI00237D26B0|nr:RNA polymerase sigma factor [Thermoleophilum album]WDT94067.1 RNA polymerase sigma factor [Thermoleophilum album]
MFDERDGDDPAATVARSVTGSRDLARLSDEELVEVVREAQAAGDVERARRALEVLLGGYFPHLKKRAQLRLAGDLACHAEDVAQETLSDATSSLLAGKIDASRPGSFRAWLHRVLDRRIDDFFRQHYRRQEAQLQDTPLDAFEATLSGEDGRFADRMHERETLFAELRALNEHHRAVVVAVELRGDAPASVAARIPGMTVDNVYQICSRFRRQLQQSLRGRTEGE